MRIQRQCSCGERRILHIDWLRGQPCMAVLVVDVALRFKWPLGQGRSEAADMDEGLSVRRNTHAKRYELLPAQKSS